jgi:hypothetical protein
VAGPDPAGDRDALNRGGEEPEAESGAGYGSHSPDDASTGEAGAPPEQTA